jgi:peptidoglycan hydrolase-like protein with peptidoglycan-binding domain
VSATVQAQQNWLISRGYDLGPSGADGIAGPMYAAAVQRYQTFLRAYGYTGDIDGDWGPGTQAAHAAYYAEVTSPKDQTIID